MYFHPLNFIRFVLAIGVLLFHYGQSYFPFNEPAVKLLIQNSSFRVSFFFFISGFVMSLVYGRSNETLSPRHFYRKRFSRIFPVYWLAFVVTLLAVVFIKGAAPKGFVILLHALGLQSWNPGYVLDLNFTTWSVSVELFFYAVFPFILNGIRNWSPSVLFFAAAGVWLVQSAQHVLFVRVLSNGTKQMEEFISAFPLWHLGTFFVGMAVAKGISLNKYPEWLRKHATFIFVFSLLVFAAIIYLPNPILKYVHNGLLSPLFALCILSLYYDKSLIGRILGAAPLSQLGNLSYGIFIFQYPIWIAMSALYDSEFVKNNVFFYLYLIVVLCVSWVMHLYFEKPILKKMRSSMKLN